MVIYIGELSCQFAFFASSLNLFCGIMLEGLEMMKTRFNKQQDFFPSQLTETPEYSGEEINSPVYNSHDHPR
jgi:hypothetical protein